MTEPITIQAFTDAPDTADWRVLENGATACYRTPSIEDAARLVSGIAALPGIDAHRPGIDIRSGAVTVRLLTRSDERYGLTARDLELAQAITRRARELGLTADVNALQSLLIVPGAPNVAAIMPFWRAVLGYEPRADSPDEDLVDPNDRDAPFWFEAMDEPRPGDFGAIHVAVWVPAEQAEARVAAALASGGRLVRDSMAPAWWTLADPAGNEVDVATTVGRG